MSKIYLGKMVLHWCDECNLPVLGPICACQSATRKVNVTPPGDIRPAFDYDIDHINATAIERFGAPLIADGKIAILNKVPSEDRMEEIIVDGVALANIRFEIISRQWMILLRMEGADYIFNTMDGRHNWVMIDSSAVEPISKGASTLAPGVIDADPGIVPGDEVVVLSPGGKPVASGRARMSGTRMIEASYGIAVRTRWSGMVEDHIRPGPKTWDEVVNANLHILEDFENKAHTFIKNVIRSTNKTVTVSYSGGKDSLVTLLLVRDCHRQFDVLFVDTGLEFPETLENIDQIVKQYNLSIKKFSAGDVFWESLDMLGPPTVEDRWCSRVCKMDPISRIIDTYFPNGCLTFIGQRRYESAGRARSDKIWKNPLVGNQVGASPIQNWTALHVWLYLFWKQASYNPLYEQGFDRIGCWLCPSSSMSDLLRIKQTHPQIWDRFEKKLRIYAEKNNHSESWMYCGLWRWQNPPKVLQEMEKKMTSA